MAASAASASPTALATVMGDSYNGGDGGIAAMAAATVIAAQAAMATQACRPAIDLPTDLPTDRPIGPPIDQVGRLACRRETRMRRVLGGSVA